MRTSSSEPVVTALTHAKTASLGCWEPRRELYEELLDLQIPQVRARKAVESGSGDVEEAIGWRGAPVELLRAFSFPRHVRFDRV